MVFNFPPQNLANVLCFFAVMLTFYLWVEAVKQRTRSKDEKHVNKMEIFQKKLGRACLQGYGEISRANRKTRR